MRHYNTTLLSFVPLTGWYRYQNLFQIVPASPNDPRPPYDESGHYPLQLEVSYDPQVWPERKSIVWHRDVWEHDRYEFIKNKWSNKKITPADGYYEAMFRKDRMTYLFPLFWIIQKVHSFTIGGASSGTYGARIGGKYHLRMQRRSISVMYTKHRG